MFCVLNVNRVLWGPSLCIFRGGCFSTGYLRGSFEGDSLFRS